MSVPSWVPAKWHDHWQKPWYKAARQSQGFKDLLWQHGYLSPNFTRAEAKCHDGTALPSQYKNGAQTHAFYLERVRHKLGRSLSALGWYRSPAYNSSVGGVSNSQHLYGDATDWAGQPDQSKFNAAMREVFEHGGIGSGASSGNVQHVDNGAERRWTYPGR